MGDRAVLPVVRRHGRRLASVELDHRDVGQALLGDAGQRAAPAAALARHRPGEVPEAPRHQPQQRRGDQGGEGELPLDPEHRGDVPAKGDDSGDTGGQVAHHEPLDRADVGGEPRDRVAEPAAVVDVAGQGQEVGEHVATQVDQEALGDPGGQVVVDPRQHAAGEVEGDVQQCQAEQRPGVGGNEDVVDEPLEEQDLDDLDQRDQRQDHERQGQPAPQSTQPGPEAPQDGRQGQRRGSRDDGGVVDRGSQRGQRSAPRPAHHGLSSSSAGWHRSGRTGGRPGDRAARPNGGHGRQLLRERLRPRFRRRRRRRRLPPLDESPLRAIAAGSRAVIRVERAMVRPPSRWWCPITSTGRPRLWTSRVKGR